MFPFIFKIEHSRVIMNMKWSSHGFLFHRNINRKENKAHTMRKTKEYIYDVQQKIFELHKIPISTIGAIINKMLLNCLEEDLRLYRPNARWGGEFEWLKTLQGPQLRIAENSWVSENLKKNNQTASTSPHVVWEGFNKNKEKTNSSILSYQTRLELQMGLASMVRWN